MKFQLQSFLLVIAATATLLFSPTVFGQVIDSDCNICGDDSLVIGNGGGEVFLCESGAPPEVTGSDAYECTPEINNPDCDLVQSEIDDGNVDVSVNCGALQAIVDASGTCDCEPRPTPEPTPEPTTPAPTTLEPTPDPTNTPTIEDDPTPSPLTDEPTDFPTEFPTEVPSPSPSESPTDLPSNQPSDNVFTQIDELKSRIEAMEDEMAVLREALNIAFSTNRTNMGEGNP